MSAPVWDERTERALLGAMLSHPDACGMAADRLTADDFYRPSHGRVFAAAVKIHRGGGRADSVTAGNMLDDADDRLIAYSVTSDVPAVVNAPVYAEAVARDAHRRRLAQASEDVARGARNGGITEEQRRRLLESLEPERSALRPAFAVHTTAELATIPPPEYLVDGLIVAGALNVLFGPSDRFKSFLAVDWSCSLASGRGDWFSRPLRPGPVVYIAGEGGSGLYQRVEAWADSRGCDPPELHWITESVNLFDPVEAAGLSVWIGSLPVPPVLVVVDTVARCMVGGDENSSRDMGIVIAHMDMLRHRYGSAVLAIHHSGHGDLGRERGSSSLIGAADCRVAATGENRLEVRLDVRKVKDAEPAEGLTVFLEPCRRSLIVARAATKTEARDGDLRDAVIDYLAEHPQSTQNAVESGVPMKAAAIRKTLMALVSTGEVTREDGSRGSFVHSLTTASRPSDAVGRSHLGNPQTTASRGPLPKGAAVVEPQSTASQSSGRTDAEAKP